MPDIDQIIGSFNREDEEKRFQDLANKSNIGYVNLVGYPIADKVLKLVPKEIVQAEKIVPYLRTTEVLKLATPNINNPEITKITDDLKNKLGVETVVSLCSDTSLNYALTLYYQESYNETSENLEVKEESRDEAIDEIQNLQDLKQKISQVPTTQILDTLFSGAINLDASDIHLEPEEKDLRVRYRIDGVLQNIVTLPIDVYKVLNSRIKYLAGLKMDIKTNPQDGRFSAKLTEQNIDVRVSTFPAAFGEVIEMRLLAQNKKFLTLQDLGFRPEYIAEIEKAISKPQGIILNTGPTGSGKTTTLYAILAKLNKPEVKIITLEDPIEYKIAGIDQSQVDVSKGYTFANGLRSILRQDPNIIMVGEIRDAETAKIAMQAAMTGHLVLTTLHTNNASGAIPRLLDMGVEPYLLSGSINLIIAQRLIRKVCSKCGNGENKKNCLNCNGTGFKGRIAIAELLIPNEKIEKLIEEKASLREFQDTSKEIGMMTMYQDGMDKAEKGITTKDEVTRVTQE